MCYLDEPEDRDIPTMDSWLDGCDAAWASSVGQRYESITDSPIHQLTN